MEGTKDILIKEAGLALKREMDKGKEDWMTDAEWFEKLALRIIMLTYDDLMLRANICPKT